MDCIPENEIKTRMKNGGLNMRQLGNLIGIKYGTLNAYMNGFSPMPADVREKINKVLQEREDPFDNINESMSDNNEII